MNAALQNGGVSQVRDRQDELADRGNQPAVRPKFHISFGADPRTKEQRRADLDKLAASMRVSRMCFV